MSTRKLNWQLVVGFLLSIAAFLSYFFFFVKFPVTRDFPWVNLLLFALAILLSFVGIRRAFASGSPHPLRSKIVGSLLAALSVIIMGFFVFAIFVVGRWLPAAHGAPQVGQKAPDFTLVDVNAKPVSLSDLLTQAGSSATGNAAGNAQTPNRGVLLIFYRGYW
jgi:hypothetical protein